MVKYKFIIIEIAKCIVPSAKCILEYFKNRQKLNFIFFLIFFFVLLNFSVIVGAPRAQSSLDLQQNINETGAIYKCSIATSVCEPYVFEALGNIAEKKDFQESNYKGEQRNNQWLGAAMDGGGHNSDSFVVSAEASVREKQVFEKHVLK